jgi:2-polyprenyl-3-methyl-5-hydroxy-6-metoxy-1,4-benzoquinol methylase
MTPITEACQLANAHWAAGRASDAVNAAWRAYELDPHNRAAKVLLSRILFWFPTEIKIERKGELLQLLQDQELDPDNISKSAWVLSAQGGPWVAAENDVDFDTLAAYLDKDDLALTALQESPVFHRGAERVLTRLRRWLLISGKWHHYQRLIDALVAQAALNGGAWPFDASERAVLGDMSGLSISAAYLPSCETKSPKQDVTASDPVTKAVTEGYERWPYPVWRRVNVRDAERLPDKIRELDPDGPDSFPVEATVLIAGCGTGKQAAGIAVRYPDAVITAIDVSESSLRFARLQCSALGLRNVRFLKLDLHDVAELKERFDAIFCSGVLHHLHNPEGGLAALTAVLQPSGIMRIMVYSRIARLWVAAARTLISDLVAEQPSDDLLRRIRQRVMEHPNSWKAKFLMSWPDFSTISGTYDLLLHPHEDPFDIQRISHVLDRLGLRLLAFQLPTPYALARYGEAFPDDPMHRNVSYWAMYERNDPTVFFGMYDFWCRKTRVGELAVLNHVSRPGSRFLARSR